MTYVKTYQVNKDSKAPTVSERQRALAQLLAQDGTSGRNAAPSMPAGNKGLALALANAGVSAVEGMAYKRQSDQEAAAQADERATFGRMVARAGGAPGVPGAGGGPGRSPSSTAGKPIQGAGSSANAATAYRYFLDKGLPEPSARALVGGFQQESGPGLNTGAVNKGDGSDGSNSIGIGQWNSDRAAGLRSFAAKNGRDPGDLNTQLDFAWSELNGPEKASLNRLMAATDDRSATAAAVGYERPAGYRVDNPEAAVTFGKRLANTTALAGLANDPGTAPAAPSTATASADLPAPNAAPASAPGLPGDMQQPGGSPSIPMLSDYMEPDGKSITPENQARYEADRAAAAKALASAGLQDGAGSALADGRPAPSPTPSPDPTAALQGTPQQGAMAPIPGSAFTPSPDLSGGVVDANVATSPGSFPTAPSPSLRDTIAAAMQSSAPAPALTPTNPNGAPDVMTQPSDLMNNAPRPDQGGMDNSLDSQSVRPMFPAPQPGDDPDPDGLRAALRAQLQGQSTAPSLGTDATLSQQNARSAAQGGAALPADAGAAIGADSGVPAILGASFVSDKAKGQGGAPFADMSGDIRAGSGAPQMAGADVPLPPKRPSQAMIDYLANGDAGPGTDPTSTGSIAADPSTAAAQANDVQVSTNRKPSGPAPAPMGSIAPQGTSVASGSLPQPDLPAPNAQPAMGSGSPGSFGTGGGFASGGGFAPVGKNANFQTPQQFNLQQSGGAPSMADVLANWSPSAPAPAAPMTPDQRSRMVSYLQDGSGSAPGSVGPGSAFRQGMDGGDLKSIAAKQYAALLGGDQGGASAGSPNPQAQALAQHLDPSVIPAPAGAPPAQQDTGYLQDAAAVLSSPYASTEEKAYAKELLDRQLPAKAEAYTLSAGQARFDGNNQQVAAVPKDEKAPDPTTDMRDYAVVVQQAQAAGQQPPSFAQYQQNLRRSGAANTTIDQRAENSSEKAYGEAQGKHFGDILNAGETARQTQGQLSLMNDAFNQGGGNITTGPFAKSILASKEAIQGLTGINLGGIPESEAINKLGFGLATNLTKEITARPAQAEFLQALRNVPGLLISPQGSKVMMSVLTQQAQAKMDLGEMVQDPQNRANWPAVERQYYASHPLMSPFTGKPLSADDVTTLAGAAKAAGVDPTTGGRMSAGGGGGGGAPPTAAAAPPPSVQQQSAASAAPDQALAQARAAIASGKSRSAVIQRLQQLGINPEGL